MNNRRISTLIFALCITLLVPTLEAHAALINAVGLIGQPDYSTSTLASPPTAQSLNSSNYSALDTVNHRLFISDQVNNRVLVYPLDSNNNITTGTASYVFGQTDFVSGGFSATPSASNLDFNHGLAYDPVNDRLFVADQSRGRVLVFDATPSTMLANGNDENAFYVFGQPDFVSDTAPTPTRNGLAGCRGLAYDVANQRLFIEDSPNPAGNNRVMIFNANPATMTANGNGENADYVLGQPNFTSGGAATTRNGFSNSAGVALDPINERLFVSDLNNNRVMVFDVSPATLASVNPGFGTAENASYVFGQANFTTATAGLSQTGLNTPRGESYDSVYDRLFVTDSANGRVMVYDASPATLVSTMPGFGTAALAENVIGQSDYTSDVFATAQNRFNSDPLRGPTYNPLNNTLFVVDGTSNRALELSFIRITAPGSVPSGTQNVAYTTTAPSITAYQGTSQTYKISSGTLPAGLTLDTATGIISGTPTVSGTFAVTLEADDNFSTGAFFDRTSYSIVLAAASSGGGGGGGGTPPATGGGAHGILPPSLMEKIVVPSMSSSTTPTYTFNANESGTISYGGGCSSSTTFVGNGDNTITFLPLSPGLYNNCTLQLTDAAGRLSTPLVVTAFTIPGNALATSGTVFTGSLKFGDHSTEVQALQEYLNTHGFPVSSTGPGSPGNETVVFGYATQAALTAFQDAHAADILTPQGLAAGTGFFGTATRTFINENP